jgi:hypothetical protein
MRRESATNHVGGHDCARTSHREDVQITFARDDGAAPVVCSFEADREIP